MGLKERNEVLAGASGPQAGPTSLQVSTLPCLSLMVLSLLETIFISYLLHLATTQPPPMPRWLHFLLLHCTSPRTCCPAAPQKGNTGLDHLPGEGSQHCPGFLFHHLRFSAPTSSLPPQFPS